MLLGLTIPVVLTTSTADAQDGCPTVGQDGELMVSELEPGLNVVDCDLAAVIVVAGSAAVQIPDPGGGIGAFSDENGGSDSLTYRRLDRRVYELLQ